MPLTGIPCVECSGLRLIVVEKRPGYSRYVQCPTCRGSGTSVPREETATTEGKL